MLSKVIETNARLEDGAKRDPLNIKSTPPFPRRDFIDCSPKTNRIASTIFDFPEPFGPTIAVTGELKETWLFLPNDLKPTSKIDFNLILINPLFNF